MKRAILIVLIGMLSACVSPMSGEAAKARQMAQQNCYDNYYAEFAEHDKQIEEAIRRINEDYDELGASDLKAEAISVMRNSDRIVKELLYSRLQQCLDRYK